MAPPTPPSTIYLLRHGAVECAGAGKRYLGWQDPALSTIGLEQARAWATFFAAADLEKICSSDLLRCRETAAIIGQSCKIVPQTLPALREINLGSWDGQRMDTIKTRYPHAFAQRGAQIADYRTPGGESFRDLQQRSWPIFENLARHARGNHLIVTHAGVIRVLLCRVLAVPLENLFVLGQTPGALNIIAVRPEGYRLQAMNLDAPPVDRYKV